MFLLLCVVFVFAGVDVRAVDPKNCKEVLKNGGVTSGLYQIQTSKGPRQVLCDQTTDDGGETSTGGWTVIQQRYNAKTSFHDRNWQEYKDGFGTINVLENFYLGNDLISELTNQYTGDATLRVETYGDRVPGSEHRRDFYWSEYLFKVLGIWPHTVGNLSTGWYDITYSNGVKFSTVDHINDPDTDCQLKYNLGGWWTNYCGLCSLNGEYVPQIWGDGYGLFFTIDGEYIINPVKTRMLIKDREP